ncbi:immediate early protein, partial [Streptomyces sp. NPDC005963]|uniref:immediate early protein n=1 Tax=Streptomyces sp. NPDC005963 TaxID=3156721 RepID=UPI0033C25DA7
MNGPIGSGPGEPGSPGDREGIRNVPRIPAPRAAADDLDPLPRHPHPPPPAPAHGQRPRAERSTADEAIHGPEEHAPPEPESPDQPAAPEPADRPAQPDRPGTPEHTDRATTPPEADMSPESGSGAGTPSHSVLKSLLGAWALAACSADETEAVEIHLGECAPCADEALRLRDAVGLLHPGRDLDLDPLLRFRVLENCLGRRPARIPVPEWATPYDAETARLDALLRDFGESEWNAPVQLKWFDGTQRAHRSTTVAGVIGHLLTVDGLVAGALGLDDPLGRDAPASPTRRTEQFWRNEARQTTDDVHSPCRDQSHTLVRTVSFAGRGVAELSVSYGEFSLPL